MSKSQILEELPRLGLADRREIWEQLCLLEERDLLQDAQPTPEDKKLLDDELAEYRSDSDSGSTWPEVQARLRGRLGA